LNDVSDCSSEFLFLKPGASVVCIFVCLQQPAYSYSQTVKQTKAAAWKQAASFVLKAEASGSVGCVLDIVNNCLAGILDIASSIVKCPRDLVRLPFRDQMLVTDRVPRDFLCLPNCIVDCTLYVFLIHLSPLNNSDA
jgi:hypothetical protein